MPVNRQKEQRKGILNMNSGKKASKLSLGIGVFAVCLLVLLPFRTFLFLNNIEGGTGFYIKRNILTFLFSILCAAAIAFLIANVFMKKKKIVYSASLNGGSIAEALAALTVAVTVLYSAYESLNSFLDNLSHYQPSKNYPTMSSYLMKTGSYALLIGAVFAALTVIYFLIAGYSLYKGISLEKHKILALSPLAWCICRIIVRFANTISFLRVSDLTLGLVMLVFLMLFFYYFARVTADVNREGQTWKLYAYGLPGALFCLLCFIPRLIVVISGKSNLLSDNSPMEYCDIAIALFIVCMLLRIAFPENASYISKNESFDTVAEKSE